MTPRRRLETQLFQRIRILFGKQYNGPCRACKELFFFRCDPADPAGRIKRTAHKGKRFFGPVLSLPQPSDCIGIQGAAGQVMPPIPFTARIPPPARSFWEERKASSPSLASRFCSRQKTWGPHSGQQSGCA